jgi:SAM-dependent methyltransferase
MAGGASPDLFSGTAGYYARYRVGYPPELLDDLATACGLDGRGRLLDLGCGTGQLAIPLRDRFETVVGVDASAEMIAEARRQAEAVGATTITWLVSSAEAITPALGRFRLVTIGGAFHWMQHDEVMRRCRDVLEPGGALALVGGGGSVWNGSEPWEQAVVEVIQRWLGTERRAGQGVYTVAHAPYPEILARGGFVDVRRDEYPHRHVWEIDSIIGLLYSTSYCRRDYLGENAPAFEADLRRTLLALEPSARFEQTIVYDCTLGFRPPDA